MQVARLPAPWRGTADAEGRETGANERLSLAVTSHHFGTKSPPGRNGDPMANRKLDRTPWVRSAGMGIDFAAAVAVFVVIGYWIDRRFGSSPWGVLVGAGLGLIGGMYNLIRQGLKATRQAVKDDEERRAAERDRPD